MDFHGLGVAAEDSRGREGLTAEYFSELEFRGRSTERIDPRINFNWADGGPIAFFSGNRFSVRWTGQLEALHSESYTFFGRSSDGIRVWLDGQLIIDRWTDRSVAETPSQPIRLEAGQRYALRVEYYEQEGDAQVHLSWSSSSTPKQVVPSHVLYPTDAPTATEPIPTRQDLLLAPIYPNPVVDHATVAVILPEPGATKIEVFDVLGRRVMVLTEAFAQAGTHTFTLSGAILADGFYLCRLTTPTGTVSRSFLVVK
jgi:hypothetical protein